MSRPVCLPSGIRFRYLKMICKIFFAIGIMIHTKILGKCWIFKEANNCLKVTMSSINGFILFYAHQLISRQPLMVWSHCKISTSKCLIKMVAIHQFNGFRCLSLWFMVFFNDFLHIGVSIAIWVWPLLLNRTIIQGSLFINISFWSH